MGKTTTRILLAGGVLAVLLTASVSLLMNSTAAAQAEFGTITTLPARGSDGTISQDVGGLIGFQEDVTAIGLGVGSRVCFDVRPTGLAENIKAELDCASPPGPADDGDSDSDDSDDGNSDDGSGDGDSDSEDSDDESDDDSDDDSESPPGGGGGGGTGGAL